MDCLSDLLKLLDRILEDCKQTQDPLTRKSVTDATAELVPQCLKGAVELETPSTRLTAKLRAVWTTMEAKPINQ